MRCVFKTTYIHRYKVVIKKKLKLHRSCLGVRGGGGAKQPSEQLSLHNNPYF